MHCFITNIKMWKHQVENLCKSSIVAIFFFLAISEIDENFKGVLVKIREVLRNQLFRD